MLKHTDQLCGLASNPQLPGELLDLFIDLADQQLCQDLVQREDLSPEQLRRLAAKADLWVLETLSRNDKYPLADIPTDNPQVRLSALYRDDAPAHWALELAASTDPEIRLAVADHQHGRADVLRMLADDPSDAVVETVAAAHRLPADAARKVAQRPDSAIRAQVAGNVDTPPDVLSALLDHGGDPRVDTCAACRLRPPQDRCQHHGPGIVRIQLAVLGNPATPVADLTRFVDFPDRSGRISIAERQDLPVELCERLAADPEPLVRQAIAENPATPLRLLEQLAEDPEADVRRAVTENPAIPLPLLESLASLTPINTEVLPRVAVATRPELDRLASSRAGQVRALAASFPNLPADLITTLIDDPDDRVTKRLASEQLLTAEQFRAMTQRHGPQLYASLATNPNCPPDLLLQIAAAHEPAQKVRHEVAGHPAATGQALVLCLEDQDSRVRVAGHPALPPSVIIDLLDDPNIYVRLSAAENPSLPVSAMRRLMTLESELS